MTRKPSYEKKGKQEIKKEKEEKAIHPNAAICFG